MIDKVNRDSFFDILDKELGTEDRERIEWAYSLAKNYHFTQRRDSGERFFEHCKAVAMVLFQFPLTSPTEVIMGLTHDMYEDQLMPRGMMRRLFGERIDEGLRALSKTRPFYLTKAGIVMIERPIEEYFAILMESHTIIRRVKLADRLHNLRTLSGCSPEKIERKIIETEQFIFPLADKTDKRFLEAIKEECNKYRKVKSGD